jgi:hypothetical protein
MAAHLDLDAGIGYIPSVGDLGYVGMTGVEN